MSMGYETEVVLPTGAKFYAESLGITPVLKFRAMTTAEEKVMYGSSSSNVLLDIVKSCCTSHKDLPVEKMYDFDTFYCLIKIRALTYGSMYDISSTCTECDNTNKHTINLDAIPVKNIEDMEDIPPTKIITLPVSNKKVEVRWLLNEDYKIIDRKVKRHCKKFGGKEEEQEYIFKMMQYCTKMEDAEGNLRDVSNELEDVHKYKVFSTMHAVDAEYFWEEVKKDKPGIDMIQYNTCSKCDEEYEYGLPLNAGFFRTRKVGH